MKPAYIELMVDRLCGIFPQDNIARNTVKSAWAKDEFLLLNVDESQVKDVLKKIENDGKFPSLARVKSVFREIHGQHLPEAPHCDTCNNTGWDDGSRWEETDEGYRMTRDYYRMASDNGLSTTYVKACKEC